MAETAVSIRVNKSSNIVATFIFAFRTPMLKTRITGDWRSAALKYIYIYIYRKFKVSEFSLTLILSKM